MANRMRFRTRMRNGSSLKGGGSSYPVTSPTVTFDLTTALPPNFACVRTSQGTYRDINGVWRSANNNVPRFHMPYGATKTMLLTESAIANRMTSRNANPTDATGWTKGGDAAGTVAADIVGGTKIADAGLNVLNTNGRAIHLNAAGAVAPVTLTSTGTVQSSAIRHIFSAWLYVVSGTLTMSATTSGLADSKVIAANSGFVRQAFGWQPNNAADAVLLTLSAGGEAYILLEQFEQGRQIDETGNGVPTSPVVTLAATGARSSDRINDSALNTRPYFNTEMAVVMKVWNEAFNFTDVQYPFTVGVGAVASDFVGFRINNDNGYYRRNISNASAGQTSQSTHKPRLRERYPIAFAWKATESTLCAGYDSFIETTVVQPTGLSHCELGALPTGSSRFIGCIESITFFNTYPDRRSLHAAMYESDDKAIFCSGQSNEYGFFRAQIDQTNSGERNGRAVMEAQIVGGRRVMMNGTTNGSLAAQQSPNPATDFWWCTIAGDGVTLTLDGNAWQKFEQMATGFKVAGGQALAITWAQGDGGQGYSQKAIFKQATKMIFDGMRSIFPNIKIIIDPIGRYLDEYTPTTTSATSNTIGTGTKNFTTAASNQFFAGQEVSMHTANPIGNFPNNYMVGTCISCVGTALSVNVHRVTGSGTFTAWWVDKDAAITQPVREVHRELAAENPSWITVACEKANLPVDDFAHLDDVLGYGVHAPRVISKALKDIGYSVTGVDGPRVTSITRSGATVTVGIAHDGGTDITMNANAGDFFAFMDGATRIPVIASSKINATSFTVTLATVPAGGNVETLHHVYDSCFGDNIQRAVLDNSPSPIMLRSVSGVLPYTAP